MWLTHFWHSWSQFFIFAWDVTAGGILRTGVLICLVDVNCMFGPWWNSIITLLWPCLPDDVKCNLNISNRPISQMQAPLVLAENHQGSYDNCARCFMFLNIKCDIFQSMSHLPVPWYFDTSVTYPQWFLRFKIVLIPPHFVQQQYLRNIAIQPAMGCYNSWANLRCSSCSPPGENLC